MNSYKRLFKRYQGFGVSFIIIVVIVVGVFVGVLPAFAAIISMRKNVSDLSNQITILRQKASILESIDEEAYKAYLTELSLAVPTDKSLTSLFATIDGLSQETGVTLSNFTLTKPGSIATESAKRLTNDERKVGSSFLPFTLTVSGTYDQIRTFVERSVLVRRFFRIRHFSISFDQKETFSVHMGMDAYYAPLPTNLGSASQTVDSLTESDQAVIERVLGMPVLGKDSISASTEESTVPVETAPREDPFSL